MDFEVEPGSAAADPDMENCVRRPVRLIRVVPSRFWSLWSAALEEDGRIVAELDGAHVSVERTIAHARLAWGGHDVRIYR